MPAKNQDLHGSAPDQCENALLLIDVINDLDFPEAEQMLPHAREMAQKLVALKKRAREAGVPCIYVNDNFGKWKSDFRRTVEHCLREDSRGREIVETLRPDEDDYFVLKPKHSGFFSTTLETLLNYVGAKRLILGGIAGNFCVLFTANDAYMRDFELLIPEDCCVSNTPRENDEALALMRKFLKADTRPSDQIDLAAAAKNRRAAERL
ncbi:MAG TPA: isochorismatase family cysteine hydrolase [Chthoniobacterales bacterium]